MQTLRGKSVKKISFALMATWSEKMLRKGDKKQNKTRIGKLIRAARKLSTDCKAQVFRMRICCPRRPISISPQENFTLAAASAHLHISKAIILLSAQGTRDKRKEAKPGSSPLCFVEEIRD